MGYQLRLNAAVVATLVLLEVTVRAGDGASWAAEPPAPHARAPYKAGEGPFSVGVVEEVVLHDPKREKDLRVKGYYPQGEGPFPVVLFSHGFGGNKNGYEPLGRYWASHGYVSLHPTHYDSGALQRLRAGGGLRSSLAEAKGWGDRVADLSFILDSLAELEARVPALKGKLDRKRIGVGGHSYGAYTAQLIGGATVDVPGGEKDRSYADPRVMAVILMSGQGTGQQGLTDRSWRGLNVPMLSMTGSADQGAQGQGPEWKKQPFDYSPPGDKYHLLIDGAHHGSFSGRFAGAGNAPGLGAGFFGGARDPGAIFGWVKSAGLAFWDAYLKNDASAKAYLQSDSLPDASGGKAKLFRK